MSARDGSGLDRLRQDGQALMEELSREYYAAHAGLQQGAELQQVYARHPAALGDEPLAMTREAFLESPSGSEAKRQSRMLLDWQVEALASRELAPLEEREIAWEGAAMVRLPDGRGVPFQKVSIEIANSGDRAARLEMEEARASLVERELHPMRDERLQRERELTESLQLADGYVPAWELLSGIDLRSLRDECAAFLRDTQAMWSDTLPRTLRKRLDISVEDATRSDALALFRARQFDEGFPARRMESSILGQVGEMGIDALAEGRIRLDTGEREGKRARAFCAPVRVPEEVYLVLRPHGGQGDWTTFLHELGHALHFAYMRPELPFEYRWLGDNSVTEGYAMLFDHLMHDGGWVKRYTELPASRLPEYHHSEGFAELHMLRRYCAKLVYEVAMYDGSVPWRSVPDLYVETLTAATTFRYRRADALVDIDPRFYAARYLRAWQLQALLTETLRERYDVDWWRNPRCGPWMVAELFGEAQRELAHEQAARVTGKKLDFAPLVRSVERLLG